MPPKLRSFIPAGLRTPLGAAGRSAWCRIGGPLQRPVQSGSLLAVCHCHDPALVPELATGLLSLPRGATLHVTSSVEAVFKAWDVYRNRSPIPIRYHAVENRGRDLRPFFEVARGLELRPETIILKIHGKRSLYSLQGDWWRRDTIRGLFPGPFAARRTARRFLADPRLALLGAPGSFISHPVYWGDNRERVGTVMTEITGRNLQDDDLGFIAGTMFWISGGFLSALLPHIDLEAFEPEPLPQDGAYAHAIERVIGMAALALGWHVGEVGHPGILTRDAVRHRTLGYL